jgi:hypothetical protein
LALYERRLPFPGAPPKERIMKSARLITSLSMATFLTTSGCGSAPSSQSGSPSAADSSRAGTTEAASVSIRGFVHSLDGRLLSGVSVCVRSFSAGAHWVGPVELTPSEPASCATSGSDGSFQVSGASANTDLVPLTFEKDGFVPTVRTIATQSANIALPEQQNTLLPNPTSFLGTPMDPGKGQIAFSVATVGAGSAPEASVTAVAFSNATAFDGPSETPTYVDAIGSPAVGATAGTAGGFVNVPSGLYVVQFHAATTCVAAPYSYGEATSGPPSGQPTDVAVVVPVFPGYVSAPVVAYCASL